MLFRGVSVRGFLDEIRVSVGGPCKANGPPQCGWTSPSLNRTEGGGRSQHAWLPQLGILWDSTYVRYPACMHAKSIQLCLTLNDPMDCSPPGSSVHGILQARILEWVAMPFSRGSSPPGMKSHLFCSPALAGRFFTTRATWKPM